MWLSLKSNGRFVAEFGGNGNIATLVRVMQEVFQENKDFGKFKNPWFFPSVDEYKYLLEQEGFVVKYIALIPRPTPLKSGVRKWLEIFAGGITNHLSLEQKNVFVVAVEKKLATSLHKEKDEWVVDYVRLRFEAIKT